MRCHSGHTEQRIKLDPFNIVKYNKLSDIYVVIRDTHDETYSQVRRLCISCYLLVALEATLNLPCPCQCFYWNAVWMVIYTYSLSQIDWSIITSKASSIGFSFGESRPCEVQGPLWDESHFRSISFKSQKTSLRTGRAFLPGLPVASSVSLCPGLVHLMPCAFEQIFYFFLQDEMCTRPDFLQLGMRDPEEIAACWTRAFW